LESAGFESAVSHCSAVQFVNRRRRRRRRREREQQEQEQETR
jgi:hypothetical protein